MTANRLLGYLLRMLAGAAGGAAIFGALVVLTDAIWLFDSPDVRGFNALKSRFVHYTREMKPVLLARLKPRVLILGASTAENGYAPDFEAFGGRPGFNVALGSASLYEIHRLFQHALHEAPVETAVFTADLATYTLIDRKRIYGFREGWLSVDERGEPTAPGARLSPWSLLLRPSYYVHTVSTIRQQNPDFCETGTPVHASHLYRRNGQRMPESGRRYAVCLGNERVFSGSVRTLASRFAKLDRGNLFPNMDDGTSKWDILRQTLRLAHAREIDFRINFPPCHAGYLEVIHRVLGPSALHEFKRRVLGVNLEVAREAKREPFPVWDFCTYNRFTTARIVDSLEQGQVVEGFMDLQHFDSELGARALGVMLGSGVDGRLADADFGVRIRALKDLVQLERRQARRRLDYQAANPDEIRWLTSKIAAAVEKGEGAGDLDLAR
jgi:hypothetical protein